MGAAAEPGTTRRDALRKAGADYLEKAMQQAKLKGSVAQQDPFAPQEPPPGSAPAPAPLAKARSGSMRRRAKLQQPVDPEFAAFGAVFESTKLYLYMGVYLVSQACIYGEPAGGQHVCAASWSAASGLCSTLRRVGYARARTCMP